MLPRVDQLNCEAMIYDSVVLLLLQYPSILSLRIVRVLLVSNVLASPNGVYLCIQSSYFCAIFKEPLLTLWRTGGYGIT